MDFPVGVYKAGKLVKIISKKDGKPIEEDCDRLVNLRHRPDIKVGHVWGTEPEGYGVTYTVVDGKIVSIELEKPE